MKDKQCIHFYTFVYTTLRKWVKLKIQGKLNCLEYDFLPFSHWMPLHFFSPPPPGPFQICELGGKVYECPKHIIMQIAQYIIIYHDASLQLPISTMDHAPTIILDAYACSTNGSPPGKYDLYINISQHMLTPSICKHVSLQIAIYAYDCQALHMYGYPPQVRCTIMYHNSCLSLSVIMYISSLPTSICKHIPS